MRLTLILLPLLIASTGYADVPEELKRTAPYKLAQHMMMKCTSAPDALLCLSESGSECAPIEDAGREAYRCHLTVNIEASRIFDVPQAQEARDIGEYVIISRLVHTDDGWSAEIEEVTRT